MNYLINQNTFNGPPAPPPGAPTVQYQWQVSTDNGITFSNLVGGPNSATLSLTNIKAEQDGYLYRAYITSGTASVLSEPAKLVIFPTITIDTQPTDQLSANNEATFNFSASSADSGILSFQWQVGNPTASLDSDYIDIIGATGLSLTLTDITEMNDGYLYRAKVVGRHSISYSKILYTNSARLTYNTSTITIVNQPVDYTITDFTDIDLFSVFATSNSELSYQWEESADGINFTPILLANDATLYASSIIDIDNKNDYKYRVLITSTGDSVYSDIVNLYMGIELEESVSSSSNPAAPVRNATGWGDPHYTYASSKGAINALDDNGPNANRPIVYFYVKYPNGNSYKIVSRSSFSPVNATNGPAALVDMWLSINNQKLYGISGVSQSKETPSTDLILDNYCTYAGLTGWDYLSGRCLSFSTQFTNSSSLTSNYNQLIRNSIKWLCKNKSNPKVLIIGSGDSDQDILLKNVIATNITTAENVFIIDDTATTIPGQYFDTMDVIVLQNNYISNFVVSGSNQNAIKQFVSKGGGLLTFEWIVRSAAQGKLKILSEVLPVVPVMISTNKSPTRFIQNISDNILNQNVNSDFSFISNNVDGIETCITEAKSGSTIFYYSEQCMDGQNTQSLNAGNILTVTYSRTNGLWGGQTVYTMFNTWSSLISYKGKIKIGGIFYWTLKSLIESQKKNPKPQFANAWLSTRRRGLQSDGYSVVLKPYGLNRDMFTDAVYADDNSNAINAITEEIDIKDKFWKNLSKLLQGLAPDDKYVTKSNFRISKHPGNRIVGPGGSVKMDCSVASTPGLSLRYRWKVSSNGGRTYKIITNGEFYDGAYTNTLTIKKAEYSYNNRLYLVEVRADRTRYVKNSNPAKLTVADSIKITQFPIAQKAREGEATFDVSATSIHGPLTYQWQESSGYNLRRGIYVDIPGATDRILNLNVTSYTQNGSKYRVVLKNNNSIVTTNGVLLTVAPQVNIISHPSNYTSYNNKARFSVFATIINPLSTQDPVRYTWQESSNGWYFKNITQTNTNTNEVELIVSKSKNNYFYRVIIACGPSSRNSVQVTSNAAQLTIAPSINSSAISQSVTYTSAKTARVSLRVDATSSAGSLRYKWYYSISGGGYVAVTNSDSNTIQINNISASNIDKYVFKVVISNNLDSITVT